jgi:integrase
MAQANGTLDFTLEERKEYELICKLLEGLKKERIVVISEFVEAVKSLEGVGTIQEAVKFFIENRPKSFTPLPIPDLVVQWLLEKQADVGARWYRSLAQHLESFAAYFTGPLHTVASVDINAWLRSLKVGGRPLVARSRHNYRAAVELLVRWAWSNGHLPRSWAELEHVPDPGNKMTSAIIVLTPKDLARLMGARQNMEDGRATMTLIPFLALMAFAGVRHEEIVGVKGRLDWRDIHLDEKQIYIPKGMAKKGEDRTVPIEPVLGAWLPPYAKRSGPICELENTSNALFRTKQAAGIKCGKNETRNALRKSFISYRRAVVKDEAQVALEAGTSVAKIRSNYGRPLAEAEGLRWFSIYPQHADVIQLPLKFA